MKKSVLKPLRVRERKKVWNESIEILLKIILKNLLEFVIFHIKDKTNFHN
jgi:hypothetical protein